MSASEFLTGAAFFALVFGASGFATARALSIPGARALEPLPRLLAAALVFAAFLFAAHLIPGLVGILARASVAACAAALAITTHFLANARGGQTPFKVARAQRADPEPKGGQTLFRFEAALGWGAVGLVAAYLFALAFEYAATGSLQPDVSSFHLPNIARWVQDGSLWQIDDFISNRAPGNYPQTGDVFMLAAILPWSSEFLVRLVALPFLALTGASIFAAGRELGARSGASLVAAAAVVAMPAVGYLGVQGVADPEMFGTFAAGGFFLLRHRRTGAGIDLALAGIGLGLAFGTRWYAVPAVAAVLVVWFTGSWLATQRRRAPWRDLGVLAGLVAAFGGFWLLRNWVESGNPVFPVEVSPGGLEIFGAPPDQYRALEGFTLAGYLDQPGVWREFLWPPFLAFMSWTAIGLWAALVGGAVYAARRRVAESGTILALVAIAALIGLVYILTPYSAVGPPGVPSDAWVNARYVIPALLVGAPVFAWLATRIGRAGVWLEALLALAVADAIRRSADFPGGDVGALAIVEGLIVAGGLVALALLLRRGPRPSGRIALAGGAAAVVLGVGAAALVERGFSDHGYAGVGEPIETVAGAPAGTRVGLLGESWAIQPLFGPELENEVAYVGPRIDGMLRPYETRPELAAALERGAYDYIYLQRLDSLDPELPELQERWLGELGWRLVAEGYNPSFGPSVTTALYER